MAKLTCKLGSSTAAGAGISASSSGPVGGMKTMVLKQALKRRKTRDDLDWKSRRSERARVVVDDAILKRIAAVINRLVDLPYWTEDQEQELFEQAAVDCLEVIAANLPPPFFDVLHGGEGGLASEQRDELKSKLEALCRSSCPLPYFDEQDKRRVIRAVVYILVDAMGPHKDLASFTELLTSAEEDEDTERFIVQIIMEGAMDVFFEEETRKALVSDVTAYVKELPFVPSAFVHKMAEKLVLYFGSHLRQALNTSYKEYREATAKGTELPVLPTPLEDDEEERRYVLESYNDQPFVLQLRRIFIMGMLAHWDLNFSFCSWPQRAQARLIGMATDIIFAEMKALHKLEHCVRPAEPVLDAIEGETEDEADDELREMVEAERKGRRGWWAWLWRRGRSSGV